jgi:hypothetical protein
VTLLNRIFLFVIVFLITFIVLMYLLTARAESARPLSYWINKQIAAAEKIGRAGDRAGTDPWPNCPDPYDHRGATWWHTVRCENHGRWLDSPGYYRCGLQFDPMWERIYGRLCP